MTYKQAMQTAIEFMERMNPTEWDGFGNCPKSFDDRPYEAQLEENVFVAIEFVANDYGGEEDSDYQTYVDLVDNNGNNYAVGCCCIPGTNDCGGIADMIFKIYNRYVVKEGAKE